MLFNKMIFLIVASFILKPSCEEDIVHELINRFYDESIECFDSHGAPKPLYECSGIIIRGIMFRDNQTKYAWSLKPDDKDKNSIPFGFLRHDHPFTKLGWGYDAGFILYPHLKTPHIKNKQKVLCAFPIDARTDFRKDRGCGPLRFDTAGIGRPCDVQNISTFTDWLSHFNKIMSSDVKEFEVLQCGFDTTKETSAQNFAVAMDANAYLQCAGYPKMEFVNSEIRLESWDENSPKQIPIQTFFYFVDSKNGRENATKFRNDFYRETGGEKVPIVGIRLPTKSNPEIYVEAADNNS